MIEAVVGGIFQTPIYMTKLKKEFSKEEISFINNDKINTQSQLNERMPGGNFTSSNKYILDEKIFKNLKQEVQLIVEDYFDRVVSLPKDMTPYITQSWLTYTESGESHHEHEHSNSYASGVIYVDCHKTLDKIVFNNHGYAMICPQPRVSNVFNSSMWIMPVEKNKILLFPSSLTHRIPKIDGDYSRISLAFNTFIKGKIGNAKTANELFLK
tara:strand:+ start:142 stop:777 length:636 start_codon:yes stop_codon:yes gene_type:complete